MSVGPVDVDQLDIASQMNVAADMPDRRHVWTVVCIRQPTAALETLQYSLTKSKRNTKLFIEIHLRATECHLSCGIPPANRNM